MIFTTRLDEQLTFIKEIDKLKDVFRNTLLMDGSRHENDAEHMWHASVAAIILVEHADNRSLDMLKVIKTLLIHDIIEVYAGDTYAYDDKGNETKDAREQEAARNIFGLLPKEQGCEFIRLWEEFETNATAEACYAKALDTFMPLWHNFCTQGKQWTKHGITCDRVLKRAEKIKSASDCLWRYSVKLIEEAVEKGYLLPAAN